MKKIIVSTFLALFVGLNIIQAQVPSGGVVYDPTAAINMGKQLGQSAEQLKRLQKTIEYLKKAEDKYFSFP